MGDSFRDFKRDKTAQSDHYYPLSISMYEINHGSHSTRILLAEIKEVFRPANKIN